MKKAEAGEGGQAPRVMARPARVLSGMTRQDDARIQRCFRGTETGPSAWE